ncbi:hypothetical protein RJ639_018244 [Escallonia herrerae]|uniref:CCHC-type domain-containing protein n=1 Tax=Escallonia herrerae TaxID=1293975 RepID=A0AA88V8R0_9ASTE|nr:hypothetical protein RJ639_018244 [Escallonia herrerae]
MLGLVKASRHKGSMMVGMDQGAPKIWSIDSLKSVLLDLSVLLLGRESKGNDGRRQQNASNEEKLCYKCHKPGHMKMDCPIYKKENKERRDVCERVKRRQLSKKENKEKERAMNAEYTPT